MNRYFNYLSLILLIVSCVACNGQQNEFILTSNNQNAGIVVLSGEPEPVHLAVEDLLNDVEKITGNSLEVFNSVENCPKNCVIIGSVDNEQSSEILQQLSSGIIEDLQGKWEAYRVFNTVNENTEGEQKLFFAGSDYRGTMFAIYDFIEVYMEVHPMYFWSDLEPEKKERLAWDRIEINQDEPAFKYRGWFINDEDLLTEWYESEGTRNIDYPFYEQVVNPEIMEHVVESMLRLRMNLIIPASFIDIKNPPERELVNTVARRGAFISMHHIEPLGVSGFTFLNYWKDKTEEEPLFSFYSSRDQLEEVWRSYVLEWSKFRNIIWQIGLRGIADQPMWEADPGIPQTDEDRGRLISEAMNVQIELIKKVDNRESIPITTTLWMEGSDLKKEGYMNIPEQVTIVFADNSPGWKWQDDFYETNRIEDNSYGVYYHHQLWGSGPHLAQGIPPKQTYKVFKDAYNLNSTQYAILNVSNIREFQFGIAATGKMLYDFESFDPSAFQKEWTEQRFGKHGPQVERLYDRYFKSFIIHDEKNVPMLLDGQIKRFGLPHLREIENLINNPAVHENPLKSTFRSNNPDVSPQPKSQSELLDKITEQRDQHLLVYEDLLELKPLLDSKSKYFLETNLESHLKIMIGLEGWLLSLIRAEMALVEGDRLSSKASLKRAIESFGWIRDGQNLNTRGEKWKHWYRGETKMNLNRMEKFTKDVYNYF